MRQDALSAVTVAELVDRHILEAHHVHVDLLVVLVGLVVVDGVLAEALGLFLQASVGTVKEGLEGRDFVLVLQHFAVRLVLVDREVQSELLKDLNWALGLQTF